MYVLIHFVHVIVPPDDVHSAQLVPHAVNKIINIHQFTNALHEINIFT